MKRKQKMTNEDFASMIKKAERAVVEVKNERLQEIAFGKVLDHLLNTSINQTFTSEKNYQRSHGVISPIETKTKSTKADGPLAWLQELVDEKFFVEPRSSKAILDELNKRSHRLKPQDLTWPLQQLCHDRKLRREKQASAAGRKKVFHWFNW